MASIDILENSSNLLESISNCDSVISKQEQIRQYVLKLKEANNTIVNDFKAGLAWVNVSEPLSFKKHLIGKIVVLDFFTYCCINCIHILPDLKALEETFSIEQGLVIIGVHSPKFSNERLTLNVEEAVKRYEITHPVVNDADETMWDELKICCWPTIYIIGPDGKPLLMLMGEGHGKVLKLFIEEALSIFMKENLISEHHIPQISYKTRVDVPNVLSYPGKIASFNIKNTQLLAISDSGNHRILISNESGKVLKTFGGNSAGFDDEIPTFHSPQGLVFKDEHTLYIADTENHAIRKIDILTDTVSTVAGTGCQGSDKVGGKAGPIQEISSPWDLCIINNNTLIIAMAGTHQIWALFLEDTVWWQNKTFIAGTCVAIAGSGREENRNNSYPMSAAFAQPSGVTVKPGYIYIADSESSSIRCLNLKNGQVSRLVGGDLDPMNLFAFGDEDGIGNKVKLQHPLGVAWSDEMNMLYIADSYNHKIKVVDVSSKSCTSLKPNGLNFQLNEPGGLCTSQKRLYIADTNNHSIQVIDLDTLNIQTMQIEMNTEDNTKLNTCTNIVQQELLPIHSDGGQLVINVAVNLPSNTSFTDGAPSKWTLLLPDKNWIIENGDEKFESCKDWTIKVPASSHNQKVFIQGKLFVCKHNVCTVHSFCFCIGLNFVDNADSVATTSFIYNCNLL